jgi:hypothetical protein
MILAVLPRRLNLEAWQWVTVAVIAALGIAFAVWILLATPNSANSAEETAPPSATEKVVSSPTETSPTAASGQASPSSEETTSASEAGLAKQPPAWALQVEETLSPLSRPVNFFYIVGDVFLLIIASTLLLAFWGGRFAQSWRMIAAATFSLYIADMYFKYVDAIAADYQSGGLLEVFYVFSGVLFAIGAALEYDVSIRSRRSPRRRT